MVTAVVACVFLKLNCAIYFYLEEAILLCTIYFACGLGRINMLGDVIAIYVTIAFSHV
jgi:hypothetical protein